MVSHLQLFLFRLWFWFSHLCFFSLFSVFFFRLHNGDSRNHHGDFHQWKWVVPQHFSCPLCIHHDGSLNHRDEDTKQTWTQSNKRCDWISRCVCWDRCSKCWARGTWDIGLQQHTHTHTLANRAVVLSTRSPPDPSIFLSCSLLICDSLSDISCKALSYPKYVDLLWSLPLSLQGCGATCCVHLPGPNHLQPEWEWALRPAGTRSGGTVLWRWTHPEVTRTHIKIFICTHIDVRSIFRKINGVCLFILSTSSCYLRSKGEECDDKNSMNGDGCSSQCKKEPFFNCVGEYYEQMYQPKWNAFTGIFLCNRLLGKVLYKRVRWPSVHLSSRN